jgi:hypothetical protein
LLEALEIGKEEVQNNFFLREQEGQKSPYWKYIKAKQGEQFCR